MAGNMEYCLALKSDGSITMWGNGPQPPSGLSSVKAISAGQDHCLALTSDGRIVAWGGNGSGQLDLPTSVSAMSSVAAGWNYSIVLIVDGNSITPTEFNLINPNWNAGVFSVSVQTRPDRSYALQYKTALTDLNWIGLPTINGTGVPVTLVDSSPTNAHRIYRVRQF
jgi:hypothetical protein